jgi:hypothetical protein
MGTLLAHTEMQILNTIASSWQIHIAPKPGTRNEGDGGRRLCGKLAGGRKLIAGVHVGKGPELVAGVQQLTAPLLFPEESVERSLQESAADDMVRMGGGTSGGGPGQGETEGRRGWRAPLAGARSLERSHLTRNFYF